MRFGTQHTGKGKYHLIPEDGESSKELCGTKGVLLISYTDVEIIEGEFYEAFQIARIHETKIPIPAWMLNFHYCKKCIKKAIAKAESEK